MVFHKFIIFDIFLLKKKKEVSFSMEINDPYTLHVELWVKVIETYGIPITWRGKLLQIEVSK